jgi:hypothetical protein
MTITIPAVDFFSTATTKPGHVFLMSNPDFPGHVKIGKTKRDPKLRVAELSRGSFLSNPFSLVWSTYVEDGFNSILTIVESYLKTILETNGQGFYKISEPEAITYLRTGINSFFSFTWKGVRYRKKQDARWAYFFELLKIPYKYLEEPINLSISGITILPDFWLPDQDCYMIISKTFMQTRSGNLEALILARKTGKVVFQFWDCAPDYIDTGNNEMIVNAGTHMTPEGEYDGMMEWGNCKICNSRHIGHLGSAELCDSANRNSSINNCPGHTDFGYENLIDEYVLVQDKFGPSEWL